MPTTKETEEHVKPLISVRSKGVSIALFPPGKKSRGRSVSIQKSWPNGQGGYTRKSVSFFEDDIPNLKQSFIDFFAEYDKIKN
jgi:hypothetical protein